jgi:hypothetical protein
MSNNYDKFYSLAGRAYIRDGRQIHSGEALLLACLVHTKGESRDSKDMADVQRLMRDHNAIK